MHKAWWQIRRGSKTDRRAVVGTGMLESLFHRRLLPAVDVAAPGTEQVGDVRRSGCRCRWLGKRLGHWKWQDKSCVTYSAVLCPGKASLVRRAPRRGPSEASAPAFCLLQKATLLPSETACKTVNK